MILCIPVSETMGTGTCMGTMTWVWVQGTGRPTSPACQESRVRVRDQVCGYSTNFHIRISITTTGMGKGTTSLLS